MDHKQGGFLTLAVQVKHLEECLIGANGDMEYSKLAKINPKVCNGGVGGGWGESVSHDFCK